MNTDETPNISERKSEKDSTPRASGVKTPKTSRRTPTTTHTTVSSGVQSNGILPLVLGVLLCLIFAGYGFVRDYVIDAGVLLGTVPAINTAACVALEESFGIQSGNKLQACEDVHIHHASGLAFTACGHAESRKKWFPPAGRFDGDSLGEEGVRDAFVVYDINTGVARVMDLIGFPKGVDRVFLGLDIFEDPSSSGKGKMLTIFLINHRRTGSVVEVLEYTLGGINSESAVRYVQTIAHELIQTPNDVLALGPRSFYVSNDHHYRNGTLRSIEETLRQPWSNVAYIAPSESFIAYKGIVSANGITANEDKSIIYVSSCHGAALHILRPSTSPKARKHELERVDYVKLDFFADNPSFDTETGSVFVAGHVQPLKLLAGLEVPMVPIEGPSRVVKIVPNKDQKRRLRISMKGIGWDLDTRERYVAETVLQNDGTKISASTTAVLDRSRGVMLIGAGFSDRGLWRCPIPKGV